MASAKACDWIGCERFAFRKPFVVPVRSIYQGVKLRVSDVKVDLCAEHAACLHDACMAHCRQGELPFVDPETGKEVTVGALDRHVEDIKATGPRPARKKG